MKVPVLPDPVLPDPVLADAKVEQFEKAKVDQLKSFILVRTSGDTATIGSGQRLLKGKAAEAILGADSWLKRAFDLRAKDVQRSITVPVPNTEVTRSLSLSDPDCLVIRVTRISEPTPFLITIEWRKRIRQAVDGLSANQDCSIVNLDAQQAKSQALCRILFSRLTEHIKSRMKDRTKHKHWVWDFVCYNLSRMAAVMVLMHHVQDDLEAMLGRRDRCFLRHGDAFIPISMDVTQMLTTPIRNHECCYLYYDKMSHAFTNSP
jgi:hypothetical protein